MLPRATRKTCRVNGRLFGVECFLALDQQIRQLAIGDVSSQYFGAERLLSSFETA
jgi:hypothetical protein